MKMRVTATAAVLAVAFGLGACGMDEAAPSTNTTRAAVLAEAAEHSCDGLETAFERAGNSKVQAHLFEELVSRQCIEARPNTRTEDIRSCTQSGGCWVCSGSGIGSDMCACVTCRGRTLID